MKTLNEAITEATKNGRVCPMPRQWKKLYDLLPNRRRKGGSWEPALPLILAAWHTTPAILKVLRLREHLEWAKSHEVLEEVFDFMVSLSENQWYHYGE